MTVERLQVRVSLDDPEPALARAAEAARSGDISWQRWRAEHGRGDALVVRLEVRAWASDGARQTEVAIANHGVFAERDAHPPQFEQQMAELALKDMEQLARDLVAQGHPVDAATLAEMYIHVELEPSLRSALCTPGERTTGLPAADAGIAEPHAV